jgi:hypothetical protein
MYVVWLWIMVVVLILPAQIWLESWTWLLLNMLYCISLNDWNEWEEFRVTKHVLISFSVGRYKNEVLCDVVLMHAAHLLLGRPWHLDIKAKYDGFKNRHTKRMRKHKYLHHCHIDKCMKISWSWRK